MAKLSPDHVLLGLLAVRSGHGYQLLDHFRSASQLGNIWNLSTSQLYNILKRLERDELIDGREEDSVDAPMRTVYWLTPSGEAALNAWLNDPNPSASTRHIRTEFLSRLYIARLLGQPTPEIVAAQRAAITQHREHLINERDCLEACVGYLSLDLRVAELDVMLEWLNRCALAFTEEQHS